MEAALGSGLAVEALFVSESGARHLPHVAPLLASSVTVLRTSDKLFAGVADTRRRKGLPRWFGRARRRSRTSCAGTALVVVLVGVQDPGNVGTIVRAAEAFGASGAATCPAGGIGTADPFGPKAMRASAGSALRLPIVHGISPAILLAQLRTHRVKVYAAVAASPVADSKKKVFGADCSSLCPWEIDWKTPSAILIGNEGSGLPAELVRAADARVYIPQAASDRSGGNRILECGHGCQRFALRGHAAEEDS